MRHAIRLLILTATLILTVAAVRITAVSGDSVSAPQASASGPQVIGATEAEARRVEWAIGRFAAVGLDLPEVTIVFHERDEACHGFHGLDTIEGHRVDICNRAATRTDPALTLLHELAHAWAYDTLDHAAESSFLETRNLDTWSDDGAAWWQQSKEQAAEILPGAS